MENINEYISQGAHILASITVVATIVARLIPSQSFRDKKKKVTYWIWKVINYLPTASTNPQTKELEKAYEALKLKHGEE